MIKETILQQKNDQANLLKNQYIQRDALDSVLGQIDTPLIKIVTGPRRAGKSVFALMLLKDKNFAYLNFDDENLVKVENYDEIVQAMFEVYPAPLYFLFDEIQNLPTWELFVNKLHRRNYNILLTGSNARLLAKELATSLTGRYLTYEILPFSFREFLEAKNVRFSKEDLALPEIKGKFLSTFEDYLRNGGYPEVVTKGLDVKTYLSTLFDSVLLKDIVKRYNVRFTPKLYDLATYLISNTASEFSFTKLKNILGFASVSTVEKYLAYLEESYLFFVLNRFSFKVKEQIKAPRKIYLVDNGFIAAKAFQFSPDTGRLMENLAYVEFIRRGHRPNIDLFYYKTRNSREVDFVLRRENRIEYLIQVSLASSDQKTREGEMKALIEASEELDCRNLILITWDKEGEEKVKDKVIRYLPMWEWLLNS